MALPIAQDSDFYGNHRRPSGIDSEHLRIIKDTALRSRLIMAGMAEGLQSPKGPQKIASIVRLYPDFSAPQPQRQTRGPRRTADAPVASRSAFGLPSVEELNALIQRIEETERMVSRHLQGQINSDIGRLKQQIATLDGDEFERAFRELDQAVKARRDVAAQVREEAFRQIEADSSFDARRFLRLVSREPRREA